jgi:GTP-binding protein Era
VKSGFVSLVGRPNAGKSSLLNHIVGVKLAIVSDKPQTTRNRILGVKNYPAGQVVFVDTPGIHRPLHRMNVRMVDTAVESIGQVDVVAAVVDASEKTGAGTRFLIDLLRNARAATVLILNKIDVVSKKRLLPLIDQLHKEREWTHIVPVSALTGENVDRLEQVLLDSLPEGDQLYPDDFLTDQPERALVAEMVREQVLRLTHAEIPFSTAVMVDQFEELKDGKLLRIYCTIFVERDSQKPIIIGRAGELIKQIGTAARQEIEKFFHTKVFLDLRVAVRESWRDDERLLDNLGVKPPSFNR